MDLKDREDAGRELAERISDSGLGPDVVLCCSVEGFEVAKNLAENLDAELDLRFSESITVPGESDVIVAGVADDGTVWIDKPVKDEFRVSGAFIDRARIVKARLLGLEKSQYSDKNSILSGKKVLLADDAVLDSNRMAAAIGSAVKQGAVDVSVAAPVMSKACASHLKEISDRVFCLDEEPGENFAFPAEPRPERLKEYDF